MKVEDIANSVSSSPSTKLSASDADADEMGQNDERMGVGLSKQKEVGMKGYMSPNMSASSKAIAQRKTILSERNEVSESLNNETQVKTGSALDPNSWDGALSSRQSGSLSVNDGSSIDQYDPLTNYLSPKPKFLRYKPNRSKEIFLRQKNEAGEEKVLFSSGSLSEEISENEEEEEEEREEEREEIEEGDAEFEEDKGWTLKGISKFLALLMTTVLYATYLSSMNTNSTSSNGFRPNDVLSNGSCRAQDSEKEAEFTATLHWGRDLHRREEKVNENKFFHQEENQLAEVADGEREVRGFEGEGEEPELEDPFHYREPTDRKIFENAIEINDDHKPFLPELSTTQLAADQELGKFKINRPEEMAGSEKLDDDHKPFSSDVSTTSELEESAKFKTNSPEKMAGSEEVDVDHKPFSVEVLTASEIAADEESAKSKTEGPEEKARSESYLLWIQKLKERSYSKNRKIENMNIQLFFQIPTSFLAFLLVLIVSIVCYRSKKKRAIKTQQCPLAEDLELVNGNTTEKISTLTIKPCSEEGRPLAPIWLEEKNDVSIEWYYNSRAPIVEFLGEFVVGGETGKTLKNRIIESKYSNNLVSVEERSAYSRPALSELSNSPLAAKKIVKKEVVEDGGLKAISTPVRRSSRIKNRTALSP